MSVSINLLPRQTHAQKQAKQKQRKGVVLLVLFTLIVLAAWIAPAAYLFFLSGEQHASEIQLATEKQVINSYAQTEQVYKTIRQKIAAASSVFDAQKKLPQNIETTKSLIQPNLTIQDVSVAKDKLSLGIVSTDLGSVVGYITNLEDPFGAQRSINHLVVDSINLDKTNGYGVKIEGGL